MNKKLSDILFALFFLTVASACSLKTVQQEKIQLTPKQGTHQFPYFETPTPVWSYNDRIPGPVIRGKQGSTLIVEESNPQPWSQDIVWLLDDWRLQKNGMIYPHFNIHPDLMHEGRWGNAFTINGKPNPEPFTRDTVLVGPRQAVVIGLIPEHQGIWLNHCHIQAHAEPGMMTTIEVE